MSSKAQLSLARIMKRLDRYPTHQGGGPASQPRPRVRARRAVRIEVTRSLRTGGECRHPSQVP